MLAVVIVTVVKETRKSWNFQKKVLIYQTAAVLAVTVTVTGINTTNTTEITTGALMVATNIIINTSKPLVFLVYQ